jgi:hypothetical protein
MLRLAVVAALLAVLCPAADARSAGRYDFAVSVTGPATFNARRQQLVPITVRVVNLGPGPSTANSTVILSGGISRSSGGTASQGEIFLSDATGHCITAVSTGCSVPRLAPNQAYRFTVAAKWRAEDVRRYAGRKPLYLVVEADINTIACGGQETNCVNNTAVVHVRAR